MANLNQNPPKCEICDKEFKSNNGSKNHFNIVHMLMKEHECNICQKVFKLQTQLNSHVKIVHENKKYHVESLLIKHGFWRIILIQWNVIIVEFSTAPNLKQHKNSVCNGQKEHKFDSCGKSFSQVGNLKSHINFVHKYDKKK